MRVAIYARVSTERQEKQETVHSQLAVLRDYAEKNNYTIHEEYVDEGYSGELLDRPMLDKLRDDAKKKLFDSILILSPDRLSRTFIYQGIVQEELKKSGIGVVFLNRPDSKDTPEDNLLIGVQGVIAEYEKAKILERTRRGKIHKAKSGLLVGSIPPYGYKYVRNSNAINRVGHYEIIQHEAKTVRLIFELLVNKGLSIRAIAKELTRRGIKPQRGEAWRTSSLHRILRNETYTGITYYNKLVSIEANNHKNGIKYRRAKNTSRKERPKDQWIPITLPDDLKIIDKNTFEKTQRQLRRNAELSPRNVRFQYLLKGLVKCGNCDSPFYGTPCHGKLFYRCGNRHRTFPLPTECKSSMVKAETLENVVWNKFCEAIRSPRLIAEQVAKLNDKENRSKDATKQDIKTLDKELKDSEKEVNRLLDAYRENIITKEQLKDQMDKTRTNRISLEKERQKLVIKQGNNPSAIPLDKTIHDYCKQIEKRLDTLKEDFEGKKYLLSLAINKIVLEGKTVRIKGIIPICAEEKAMLRNTAYTSC
jgi:site-specific DNA recombinase